MLSMAMGELRKGAEKYVDLSEKHEFPVNITTPDLRMAKALLAQYGGPDSELSAGCRYLTQRFHAG